MTMQRKLRTLFSGFICLGSLWAIATPATAAVLRNGWMYAIDPSYDSIGVVDGEVTAGGTIYETYGMAIREDQDTNRIWVAINSNLPLVGNLTGPTLVTETQTFSIAGDSVAWGDLFLDFSDLESNLEESHQDSSLFAVRFSPNNDGTLTPGVYRNVSGVSVSGSNAGFRNLYQYNERVRELNGFDTWMGELPWDSPYFGNSYLQPGTWTDSSILMPNIIGSGERIGDVTIHDENELIDEGFDPGFFFEEGSEIFGFSFERPDDIEFSGDFIATLAQECLNDGISLLGNLEPPEPELEPEDDCPVSIGQRYALQPDRIEGNTKIFETVISNVWYDPPANEQYEFVALDGTIFTEILNFPCGSYGIGQGKEQPFEVFVGGVSLGEFQPGSSVDFQDYLSQIPSSELKESTNGRVGVKEFTVRPIEPTCTGNFCEFVCDNNGEVKAFCLQVKLSEEDGDFEITPEPVPEPGTIVGTVLFGGGLVKWMRSRRKSN